MEVGSTYSLRVLRKILPSVVLLDASSHTQEPGWTAKIHITELHHNLPACQKQYSNIQEGDELDGEVMLIDEEKRIIDLSRKSLETKPREYPSWKQLRLLTLVQVSVIELLPQIVIVEYNGLSGEIQRRNLRSNHQPRKGDLLEVLLLRKDTIRQVLEFGEKQLQHIDKGETTSVAAEEINSANHSSFEYRPEKRLSSFQHFSDSYYWEYLDDDEQAFIQDASESQKGLFSEVYRSDQRLTISFSLGYDNAWSYFKNGLVPILNRDQEGELNDIKAALLNLSKQRFWFSTYTDKASNEQRFNLFNDELSIYGELSSDEGLILIHGVSDKGNSKALNFKQNALRNAHFALEVPLKFIDSYETVTTPQQQRSHIDALLKKSHAFDILRTIKGKAEVRLHSDGKDIHIFRDYLEAQMAYEKQLPANNSEMIFRKIHSVSEPGEAIRFRAIAEQNVALDEGALLILYPTEESAGTDKIGNAKVIGARGQEVEMECTDINWDSIKNGFSAKPKISFRQHRVQLEVLDQYLNSSLDLTHLDRVIHNPNTILPPKEVPITLHNLKLQKADENDNQVKAVKKGVGNENILLIQGPPGTGKTTVIAEIVHQLLEKDQKVLVTSQTHIAVDNVLEKLVDNDIDAQLLRIGNDDSIANSARPFTFERQLPRYSDLLERFNRLKLSRVKEWLELHKAGSTDASAFEEESRNMFSTWASENNLHHGKRAFFRKKWYDFLTIILREKPKGLRKQQDLLRQWSKLLRNSDELASFMLFRSLDVVFSTCIGIATDRRMAKTDMKFDVVILDEAGKANLSETMVALSKGAKLILVGDHKQLPPYFDQERIEFFANQEPDLKEDSIRKALASSFFEHLIQLSAQNRFPESNIIMLDKQFRMHPDISSFVSKSFYGEQLKDAPNTKNNVARMQFPLNQQVVFIDTRSYQNPFEEQRDKSFINPAETELILKHVIPQFLEKNIAYKDFAIISPYKAQCTYVKEQAAKNPEIEEEQLQVETLDSFQGKELDIIIFSFCRSSMENRVGFLDDSRRLNVAFSRARKKLILVGNTRTLTRPRSHYDQYYTKLFKDLVEHAKGKGHLLLTNRLRDIPSSIKKGTKSKSHLTKKSSVHEKDKIRYKLLAEKYDLGSIFQAKVLRINKDLKKVLLETKFGINAWMIMPKINEDELQIDVIVDMTLVKVDIDNQTIELDWVK